MTALRTIWGVDLLKVEQDLGSDYRKSLESSIGQFIEKGWLLNEGNIVTLTTEGKLFADYIAAQLFV